MGIPVDQIIIFQYIKGSYYRNLSASCFFPSFPAATIDFCDYVSGRSFAWMFWYMAEHLFLKVGQLGLGHLIFSVIVQLFVIEEISFGASGVGQPPINKVPYDDLHSNAFGDRVSITCHPGPRRIWGHGLEISGVGDQELFVLLGLTNVSY